MKVETWLFAAGGFFFAPIAVIYGFVTKWHEPLGVTALVLLTAMALMIGAYFWILSRRISPRPEDDPFGEIAEGAGELGHFSPYSWSPLWLGLGVMVTFTGVAVGLWLLLVGVIVSLLATVIWVFEYYRGEHAH